MPDSEGGKPPMPFVTISPNSGILHTMSDKYIWAMFAASAISASWSEAKSQGCAELADTMMEEMRKRYPNG